MNNTRTAVLVALAVATVTCNDLKIGTEHGRVVLNNTFQVSPSLWRQSYKVIADVGREIINGVIVTDQRPGKDGEAKIIEGGEGQTHVTVQLKSPSIFRGYDFHVEIYAVSEYDYLARHPTVMADKIKKLEAKRNWKLASALVPTGEELTKHRNYLNSTQFS